MKRINIFTQLEKDCGSFIDRFQEKDSLYTKDTSLFTVVPQYIAKPRNSKELALLVKKVAALKKDNPSKKELSLTARAAGTDMTGGPLTTGIVVDFLEHFTAIGKVKGNKIVVEPGVYFRNFNRITKKKGKYLPSYPASLEICALGGMVANNSGGEKTLRYGKTADYIEEMKVILADGKEYALAKWDLKKLKKVMEQNNFLGEATRKIFQLLLKNHREIEAARPQVSKNSSGYALWDIWDGKYFNLMRLFCGAQGTLGLMTEATMRLESIQKGQALVVIFLNEFKDLPRIITTVKRFDPETFEAFDDHTLRLGMRYMFIRFGLAFLPEAFMILKNGGVPRQVLLAEFTAVTQEEAEKKAKEALEALKRENILVRMTTNSQDTEKYFAVRRESFNLLRQRVKGKRTAPFIDDIIVAPEYLPEFLPKLLTILGRYTLEYTIVGHIGDGNFHIIPLMSEKEIGDGKIIEKLQKQVYKLIFSYKGSMSAEHNDGIIRTPYLPLMFSKKMIQLFSEVKRIFDPLSIFNPGKKVRGGKKEIKKYLQKSY
ncbi:MAG: FAD-binding oxidoreductase [Candidatus Harrisonbacteria bacterium]|nr:FAD-binding oxidoreductase [Candidatus Harrisonbacteria bacterium]